MARPPSVILYDGGCGFCRRGVRFVFRRDPKGRFRFASLGSPAGRELLHAHGLEAVAGDTLVLVKDGRAFVRSDAALRIARGLRAPWPAPGVFRLVPRRARDAVYSAVARRRHALGPKECELPGEALRARMLD